MAMFWFEITPWWKIILPLIFGDRSVGYDLSAGGSALCYMVEWRGKTYIYKATIR